MPWKCVALLLQFIFRFVGSTAITIKLDYNGIGFLGNKTELVCSFSEISDDKVIVIYVLNKNATGSIVPIAQFIPGGSANLTNFAGYLNGRVELKNAIKVSRQITLRITSLTCDDETDYICRILYFDESTLGTSLDSDIKRIIVKASPLQPEYVSQLTSTQVLEEGQDAAFKCDGNVGKPPGKYIWQKIRKPNNELTLYDNVTTVITQALHSCTYNGTSILTLQLAAEDNQAIMRCAEQSMASLYKDSKPIIVLYKVRKPTITKHPNEAYYVVGSGYIELKCHADGNPQSNYTWFKGDNRNHTLSSSFSFIIESNYTTKNGTYVCHAFNSWNGNIYDQFQSVDIFIVDIIPTSTPTSTPSTVIIKANDKAVYQQPWFWISMILIVVIILLSTAVVHLLRTRVPKAKKTSAYCDIKEQTLENNRYDIITSSQCALNNDGYEDTVSLHRIHGVNTGNKTAKAADKNKTAISVTSFEETNITSPYNEIDEVSLPARKTYENTMI